MADLQIGNYSVSMRKPLGRGRFGAVYSATHKDGRNIAAKQIDAGQDPEHNELKAFHQIKHEHPNIIKLHDIHCDEYKVMWLMMEFCDYGDLNKYFRDHPAKFDDINIKLDLMCQIASGLEYLHGQKIIHRDIKPQNILVTNDLSQPGNDIIKIADFGLCKFLDPFDSTSGMSSNVGSRTYKAPEFFNRRPDQPIRYHKGIDVYATGLTYLAMIQQLGSNGHLEPKMEGAILSASEANNPIGLIMCNRLQQGQIPVNVVIEVPQNGHTSNLIRRAIRKATFVVPEQRISAQEMLGFLLEIKSNPESASEGLQPMETAQVPVQDPYPIQAMDYSSEGSANLDAIPFGEPVKVKKPESDSKTLTAGHPDKPIPQAEVMRIACKVAPGEMARIGVQFLNTDLTQIKILEAKHRENVAMVNFEILNTWVNKNWGPGIRQKLHGLLSKASQKGWIEPSAYSCLLD